MKPTSFSDCREDVVYSLLHESLQSSPLSLGKFGPGTARWPEKNTTAPLAWRTACSGYFALSQAVQESSQTLQTKVPLKRSSWSRQGQGWSYQSSLSWNTLFSSSLCLLSFSKPYLLQNDWGVSEMLIGGGRGKHALAMWPKGLVGVEDAEIWSQSLLPTPSLTLGIFSRPSIRHIWSRPLLVRKMRW